MGFKLAICTLFIVAAIIDALIIFTIVTMVGVVSKAHAASDPITVTIIAAFAGQIHAA